MTHAIKHSISAILLTKLLLDRRAWVSVRLQQQVSYPAGTLALLNKCNESTRSASPAWTACILTHPPDKWLFSIVVTFSLLFSEILMIPIAAQGLSLSQSFQEDQKIGFDHSDTSWGSEYLHNLCPNTKFSYHIPNSHLRDSQARTPVGCKIRV